MPRRIGLALAGQSGMNTKWITLFSWSVAAVAVWLWRRAKTNAKPIAPAMPRGFDTQFTGAYPRYSGAISAVTGGPPEDMNEMPVLDANTFKTGKPAMLS